MEISARRLRRWFFAIGQNVFVLGFVSFCYDTSSQMIYPLLPVFLTLKLGASTEILGLIEGIAVSTAAILHPFSGWLSNKLWKHRAITVAGYSLSALTRPFLALVTASWHVLVLRFGDSVGKGMRTAPDYALITGSIDEFNRESGYAYLGVMSHAGAVIGPLLAMTVLITSADDFRLVFSLAVIPVFIGLTILALGAKSIRLKRIVGPPSLRLNGINGNFRYYLFVIIIFTLGNPSDAFLLLRAKDLGVPAALVPVIWLLFLLTKNLSSRHGIGLSYRIGRKIVIILGWIVYASVYAGFALASATWHAWLLFAVYGLYFGLLAGAPISFVDDLVLLHRGGIADHIFDFAVGLGALPASLIMGVLWHRIGPTTAFGFGAAMALLASLLMMGVRKPTNGN